jgi:hypothetical protein
MQSDIWLAFADGEYRFRHGLAQINEIQTRCEAGIGAVYARVMKGRYIVGDQAVGQPLEAEFRVDDLISIIRQGLIGGGKGTVDGAEVEVSTFRANQLVDNYVIGRPISEAWALAAAIIAVTMHGYEPKKKDDPAPQTETTDGSTTPRRSPRAGGKASSRAKRGSSPTGSSPA